MYSHRPTLGGTVVAVFGQKREKLEKGIWARLKTIYANANFPLGGTLQSHDFYPWKSQYPASWAGIFGAKKENVENIQGTHAENLLIIVEEGSGLVDVILESLESCITAENNRLLVIGNPIRISGPFYDRCTDLKNPELKERGLRNTIKISALETPNYVEGKEIFPGMIGRRGVEDELVKWGESSAYYQARVLGEFPQSAENAVFPLEIIEAACHRGDEIVNARRRGDIPSIIEDERDKVLGFDIAREGKDKSVILSLWGDVVHGIRRRSTPNTHLASLWFMTAWRDWGGKSVIDENGLGGGPYDYLRTEKPQCQIRGFVSQRKARKSDRWSNLKTEAAWGLRERMLDMEAQSDFAILPNKHRDELKADLAGYIYEEDNQGRVRIVDPPRSPDCGDALIMAHWRQKSGGVDNLVCEHGRQKLVNLPKEF